ncbi:hypothetical protein LINGRAHAP2_LOCUS28120 [Linum grandiflorum]
MGKASLDYAKELFQKGQIMEAYHIVLYISRNEAYCKNVQRLLAIYGVILRRENRRRCDIDWYRLLEVPSDAPDEKITHRFVTLKKLIAPALNPNPADRSASAIASAAVAANSLLDSAFEVLSDERSRREFNSARRNWNKPRRPNSENDEKKKEWRLLPPSPPESEEVPSRKMLMVYSRRKRYRCDPIGAGLSSHHRRRM